MKLHSLSSSLLLYVSLLLDAHDLAIEAVRIPVSGRRVARDKSWRIARILGKRTSTWQGANLVDSGNAEYWANISLGDGIFEVLIDTGSSDLWVAGINTGNTQSTGKSASVDYAIGAVQGPILTSELMFDGYVVQNQAFISAPVDSSHPALQGLIGLGPSSGSVVRSTLGSAAGDTVLDNIFRQNTSVPNFLSVLLGRSNDPDEPFPGEITVGTIIPTYEDISSQPKLPVSVTSSPPGQHWLTLLDADGVLGPDGQPILVKSGVKGQSDQLTVMFDTGFTLPQVPAPVADAIYGRIPGANFSTFSNTGPVWTVPCSVEVNVTLKFSGISFPVHPLDTSMNNLGVLDADGNPICIGSFQPITTAASSNYDMILGMAFLRNAYLLIDFGDFVDGSTSSTAPPYIQLLSTLNVSQAHLEFVQQRLGGVDNTSSLHLLPQPQGIDTQDVPGAASGRSSRNLTPYIIAASVLGGLLLLGCAVFAVVRYRKRHAYACIRRPMSPLPVGMHHEQQPFGRYDPPIRRY